MFIDSHAHLNFQEYKNEIPDVIKRAQQAGVVGIINVGSNYETSKKTIEIAEKYTNAYRISHTSPRSELCSTTGVAYRKSNHEPYAISNKLYATVGIHPIHLVKDIKEKAVFDGREYSFRTKQEKFDYDKYKKLAMSSKKVIAIGETGIDLFRIADQNHPLDKITKLQSKVFGEHIKLAKELNLPLIIHGRGTKEDPYGAYDLILKILKEFKPTYTSKVSVGGVAHCFVGNLEQAKEFVKIGFYIGFTGIVTFKNTKEIQEIAQEIPLEKILIETDCPFLAPVPYRSKRNEPAYVIEVAKKIAEIKKIPLETVEEQTTKNAKELFKLNLLNKL